MSLSLRSANLQVSTITFEETNAELSYATHGMFRYFGKLPPSVLRYLIVQGLKIAPGHSPFVDLMVGSGTSLVEAMLLGVPNIGIDVNPLSAMISKAKTTIIDPSELSACLDELMRGLARNEAPVGQLRLPFSPCQPRDPGFPNLSAHSSEDALPAIRNLDYWFLPEVQAQLLRLRGAVRRLPRPEVRNFFLATFASCIRRCSNASPRVGRIFHIDHKETPDVYQIFFRKTVAAIEGIAQLARTAKTRRVEVIEADARATGLPANSVPMAHMHPPYFALYRYSSDVLRFEMAWLGLDRRATASKEIREGFKTTDRSEYYSYLDDLEAVLREAFRILLPGGVISVVVNNSTFRDERLPVVEDLIGRGENLGFIIHELQQRAVLYQQASYHRSAREDKRTDSDYIIFARKP